MRVIHVPFTYHPDAVGGTEIYVEALVRQLRGQGLQVLVAAPADRPARYEHQGVQVRRFPVPAAGDVAALYDEGDPVAADAFDEILEEERPDAVHLHALTRGVSLRLTRMAKARGIPVVFTYHTPTVSCQRGTLMRWGTDVCDGRLDLDLCTRCTLQGLGLPRPFAEVVASTPTSVGQRIGRRRLSGGAWTALRMRELVQLRHATVRAFLAEVDHVIAVAEWVRALLVLNGVPQEKITVSRQGLPRADDAVASPRGRATSHAAAPAVLRVAFLGRFHPTKGAHVLLEALREIPHLPISLDLYGVTQGHGDARYLRHLQAMADGDHRITFAAPLADDEVIARLQEYDLLAVPSQWMESGPMVVLEAFAAGTPVLGSRLGGIAEFVRDGIDGRLVDPLAPRAWADALRELCADRGAVAHLRAGIIPPRTMTTVADEMVRLYRVVVEARSRDLAQESRHARNQAQQNRQ